MTMASPLGGLPGGVPVHVVPFGPESLPAVPARALLLAWRRAAAAAERDAWGGGRAFRFVRPDGSAAELALTDTDAACWAGAIEAEVGLDSHAGVALCLRLLALVDAMARLPWLRPLFSLERDGAELHPVLLQAAATQRLTEHARLDETRLRAAVSRLLPRGGAASRLPRGGAASRLPGGEAASRTPAAEPHDA